jgi:adenosine deaminase
MDDVTLRALPKIELHNHLDGGLRPLTVLELADEIGYDGLPATGEDDLAAWFHQGGAGSLERYLNAFSHTVAVMQTREAIERVAYEAVADLHADGVIYAEIRFAPVLLTKRGLRREDAIEAALAGFARGEADTGTKTNLIVDALRNLPNSEADALAAAKFAGKGVVGFDLAGPEAGFPPSPHEQACRIARDNGLSITIHAGEADEAGRIIEALDICGADRIGHGIHVLDDVDLDTGEMGPIASRVRDEWIPLEVCPTSNLHTLGISVGDHPIGRMLHHGFNVTLNTDNRLMSGVTLTDEYRVVLDHQGFTKSDLMAISIAASDAAFADSGTKRELRSLLVEGYASLPSSQDAT